MGGVRKRSREVRIMFLITFAAVLMGVVTVAAFVTLALDIYWRGREICNAVSRWKVADSEEDR